MNKYARNFLQNTDRLRSLLGEAIREYRNAGKNTEVAIDEFAPFTTLSRHQVRRFFYNNVPEEASDADLDGVSAGFIKAMLSLADYFEGKAQRCRDKARIEMMCHQRRVKQRGSPNCSTNTQTELAA